jgi:hypothetical protein
MSDHDRSRAVGCTVRGSNSRCPFSENFAIGIPHVTDELDILFIFCFYLSFSARCCNLQSLHI